MPRYETRKPMQSGRTRRRADQVPDNPMDKRTWSREQRWGVLKPSQLKDAVREASDLRLRQMSVYFKRIGDKKRRKPVEDERRRRGVFNA